MGALLKHLQFLEANTNLDLALVGEYNYVFVVISVLVACMAAYSALRIVERVNAAHLGWSKFLWLAAGTVTMGIGVWAMHFVGMLAFILPVTIYYDPSTTFFSMLPALLASGIMFWIISRQQITVWRLGVGGTLMGAGIGLMHYAGMAAMYTTAVMLYDLRLFIASIGVAVVLATIALYTKFFLTERFTLSQEWVFIGAAVIMGLAVAGMHYTGMGAVHFFPEGALAGTHSHSDHVIPDAMNPLWLGAIVALVTLVIISITIAITVMDQRLEMLRKYGIELEGVVAGRTQELRAANGQLQLELVQRREAQDALRLAKEAAEAATRAKAEFLANMSHEIRTPLNAIVGMTELLTDTTLVDEQRDFVGIIRTSSESLLNVINDILDYSKVEAQKLEIESQPLDLRKCVEEALDILVVKASEHHLELAFLPEGEIPSIILGDITRLRQILLNVLNNAIKFTDAGEVVVMVESKPLAEPPAAALERLREKTFDEQNNFLLGWCELHFSVRDTGMGIAAERMERLFQSFSQVDNSITRRYGGTGLGLVISQRLAELMGGRMWAESAGLGQGSTFHFTIQAPIVSGQLPLVDEKVATSLTGKRGLVVDDNAISILIITRQLESWGIHVDATTSVQEALRLMKENKGKYDFAMLDFYMPEMDGFSLARQLRAEPFGEKLPMIMLSGKGNKVVHAEAEKLNFAAFLAKPLKQAQLGSALVEILMNEQRSPQPKAFNSSFDPTLGEKMPLRILLAEDNLVNQKVAQHMLARVGYQIDVVNNGRAAVQSLDAKSYDVILMDVQMPEMDGLAATQAIIAKFPPEKRPYIIAMTAHALTGDEEKCIAAGMNAYVSKPIQMDKLVAALKQSQSV